MIQISKPFCDFLSLSFPLDGDVYPPVVNNLIEFLTGFGLVERSAGLYEVGGYGGTVRVSQRKPVCCFSLTGAVMRTLRESDALMDLAQMVDGVPHRVTRLDASCDFCADAPAYIQALYRRVRLGSIKLGKKRVENSDMTVYFNAGHDGRRTGTVYLGGPKVEVRGCVYDKRHEMLEKGLPDPGPLLRIEIRLRSQVGCTVWDMTDPDRLYHHYAQPDLSVSPVPVRDWAPYGTGYTLEPRQAQYTAWQRLEMLLDDSAGIQQMLNLTAQMGSGGSKVLFRLLGNKLEAMEARKALLVSTGGTGALVPSAIAQASALA